MKMVCNASPLITLAKAGLLDILHALCEHVVVPQAVFDEVMAGNFDDLGRIAVCRFSWLERVVLAPPASRLSTLQLGAGEAEVIEWSLRKPEYIALLDDRAARRAAAALGVRSLGTLRLLFEASRQNRVAFSDSVKRLRDAGLYCDPRTIDLVRRTEQTLF